MMKYCKSSYSMMMPRTSRNIVSGLLYVLHDTSKPYAAIRAAGFTPTVLRKVTLSLGVFNPPRVQTS